jgi:hypothetical protein
LNPAGIAPGEKKYKKLLCIISSGSTVVEQLTQDPKFESYYSATISIRWTKWQKSLFYLTSNHYIMAEKLTHNPQFKGFQIQPALAVEGKKYSTVVEQLTHNPTFEGLNPAIIKDL